MIEGWEGERDDGVWVSTSKCNGHQWLVILRGGNQAGIGSWPKTKLDQSSGHKPEGTNETPRCFQARVPSPTCLPGPGQSFIFLGHTVTGQKVTS